MKVELNDINHPVNGLARIRADNNELKIATVDKIRKLVDKYSEIEVFGYYDVEEFKLYNNEPEILKQWN